MKKIMMLWAAMLLTVSSIAATKTIDCFDCTVDYYEQYFIQGTDIFPLWNIGLRGRGGEHIVVAIVDWSKASLENAGQLVDGQVYGDDDMVTDYSGVTLPGSTEELFAETGNTLVMTHDEEGKRHVEIHAIGKLGTEFVITYDEGCEMIGEAIELSFSNDEIELVDNTASPSIRNFQIIAEKKNQVSLMVAVNSDHVAGTYTIDDMIDAFSDITWYDANGDYSVLHFCDLEMTVTPDPNKAGAYTFDINVVTKVGWGYHTHVYSTPWERPDVDIIDTATIVANNLRMMDYREAWGELFFLASSPDYSLNLYVRSQDTQGTFTEADIDFEYNYIWYWDEHNVERQTMGINGEYTYVEDAEGNRSLTGWLDCDNGVHYILDLKYAHAQPTRVVQVEMEGILDDQRDMIDAGGFLLEGYGDEQYMLLGIFSMELEGTFTEQQMDWQTTYIIEYDAQGEEYPLSLLDAQLQITKNTDGESYDVQAVLTMQAEFNKSDVVEYDVHMTAWYQGAYEGVENTLADTDSRVEKVIENGELVIIRGGVRYGVMGDKR